MQIHVKTSYSPDGMIATQVIDDRDRDIRLNIAIQVINTRDAQVREALIKLGWTPPPSK
ncbi:hypothetical protein N5D52_19275 [Pseudomonas sp. GD03860]|uniref:hypothetical protein n=1 Tax=Pseudomonas sp. GD03860 TaxID=2975389 RepID=UPI002448F913|nr:hypothetical protein [Pseudomonas sp. GD03860]MDH0639081.1 hypothetical protein [Pseudomonas sp. GD03860]